MYRRLAIRQANRRLSQSPRTSLSTPKLPFYNFRALSSSPRLFDEDKYRDASTSGKKGASGDHEGQYARTSKEVRVEYPEEHEFPRSKIVQGRGGMHFKRTLPSFSLEDRVAMVTGGARGLGLVMTQALVNSGADVAIIDLNSMCSY
jgi:D-arabinitol 2-dehydrogenase